MSHLGRKGSKNKLKISEKMAPKAGGRRKKPRLADTESEPPATAMTPPTTTTTTTTRRKNAAALALATATATPTTAAPTTTTAATPATDVEIKQERVDEHEHEHEQDEDDDEAAAAAVAAAAVEYLDVKPDINELNKELFSEANTVVVPPSVLPTLFIISQLPAAGVANAAPGGPATAASTAALAAAAAAAGIEFPAMPPGANATRFLEDAMAKDEFDLQESDSDEDGYSDIVFDTDDEMVEDDEDTDQYDPQWTDQPTAPRMVFMFGTPPQNVGLVGRPKSLEPGFYVEKMLGSRQEFFAKIASGSNAWAHQQMAGHAVAGKIYLKDITGEEMQIFMGICLQMGALKLRTLAEYWSEKSVWGFRGFGSKMSLNRFQMILRVLNFDHLLKGPQQGPGAVTEPDAFGFVLPLVEFFNAQMQEVYNCGQRLVLNQPVLFWKGRFSWLGDVNAKFRSNSVLLHLLMEHTGLVQKIVLDVERKERRVNVRNSKLLAAQRVGLAKEILRERLCKGHTVYVSKYYGSYALAHELGTLLTYCTGYVDNKRYGNSKQLILTNLEPNSFAIKYAASIMMGKWRLREKCSYFFSSDCLAIYPKETSIRTIDKRPKIIKELDWQLKLQEETKEHMLAYQLCLDRKELKWDKHLAIYIVNLMILNAFLLYQTHAQCGRTRYTTTLKTYAEFRQEFVATLLGEGEGEEKQPASSDEKKRSSLDKAKAKDKRRSASAAESEDEQQAAAAAAAAAAAMGTTEDEGAAGGRKENSHRKLLEVEHMPMIIPRRKGKVMKKKCRICRKGGMLTFSKLCCEVCPGMPGLCETPCFRIWHDQLKKSLEAGENIKTRIFGTSGKETIYF